MKSEGCVKALGSVCVCVCGGAGVCCFIQQEIVDKIVDVLVKAIRLHASSPVRKYSISWVVMCCTAT